MRRLIDSRLIARGFKMYPEPYKREGTDKLYFNYIDPASGKRKLKACGTARIGEAKKVIKEFMDGLTKHSLDSFLVYSEPYLDHDTNPRRRRYEAEGKLYSRRYVESLKLYIRNYIAGDKFALLPIGEIRRGDIIDLRSRLMKQYPEKLNTINKVIKAVASILSEAEYRGDITANPASRVGEIKYQPAERGIFSTKEVHDMFSLPHLWQNVTAFHVFMFAAYTGRRASEILALEWEQIEGRYCTIDRAWKKAEGKSGSPKWNKCVTIPLPQRLILPDKFGRYVFNDNGRRLGETWWRKHFNAEMDNLGIDRKGRNITAHSFRHSLNTNLLLSGISELLVKKYMGWSAGKDTQSLYTHIKPEHLIAVADRIDEMYSGISNTIEFRKEG